MDRMRWFAITGDLECVLSVWDEYRAQEKQRPCTESYNIVMNLYAQKGKDLDAVRTFHSLIEEGRIPNSRTYTVMIEHLLNCEKIDMAKEVFDVLPLMRVKRTLRQFSLLMDAFSKLEEYDTMKSILFEMQAEGAIPGRSMLPSLQRLREAGFLEETDEFIQRMLVDERIEKVGLCEDVSDEEVVSDEVEGFEGVVQLKPWLDPSALASALQQWRPDEVSSLEEAKFVWTSHLVCKMIRHFRSSETAWQFFCWVAYQPEFTHDVHTVSRMIVKLSRSGNFDLADKLMLKMKTEGMKLAFSTVRLIVDFCGLSKNGDVALKVFRDVQVLCGSVSKSEMLILYSSLLRSLTKCRRGTDAMSLVDEMCSTGFYPDIQTFSGLMHHFAASGEFRTVQRLFGLVRRSGLEPDAYTYKVLMNEYCNCGKASLAFRLFEDMRNSDLIPDSFTKALLVKSLWKDGKLREAAIVEESCEDANCALPLVLPGHLFSVSSADLMRVYKIYSSSFSDNNGL